MAEKQEDLVKSMKWLARSRRYRKRRRNIQDGCTVFSDQWKYLPKNYIATIPVFDSVFTTKVKPTSEGDDETQEHNTYQNPAMTSAQNDDDPVELDATQHPIKSERIKSIGGVRGNEHYMFAVRSSQ